MSTPPSEKEISRWLRGLESARRKCLAIHEDMAGRGLARLGSDRDFELLASKLYRVVASEVYELLRGIWRSEAALNGRTPNSRVDEGVFFWPGYLRYATATPGRLDVLGRDDFAGSDTPSGKPLVDRLATEALDGLGFVAGGDGPTEVSLLPLSVWMRLFYSRKLGAFELHGFTRWIAENGDSFVVPERSEHSAQVPLVAVEFAWGSAGEPTVEDGVLRCPLDESASIDALECAVDYALNRSELVAFSSEGLRPRTAFPPSVLKSQGESAKSVSRHGLVSLAEVPAREIASRLLTIVFASMFVNCESWGQDDRSHPAADRLLTYVNETKRLARSAGFKEAATAVSQGVDTIRSLPSAVYGRVFRYYYAMPLPRSMTIQGFHRIEGDLGSVNLYTTRRIPALFLQLLQVGTQRIYEDLRLLEIAIDARQRGLRTAAGAFQHEIKHLASAVGSRWVVPAETLFDIGAGGVVRRAEERVGVIELEEQYRWLSEGMGLAPFREVLGSMVSLLKLWTMSDSVADLPFKLKDQMTAEPFVRRCVGAAQQAIEPHAMSYLSAESVAQLQKFRLVRDTLRRIWRRQRKDLELDLNRMLLIPESESSVWFARLLISVLKNAVQHGSVLEPIRLSLTRKREGRLRLSVRNRRFRYGEVKTGLESGVLGAEAARIAEDLAKAFNAVDQGAEEFSAASRDFPIPEAERKKFRSGEVIDVCLWRLNGKSLFRDKDPKSESHYLSVCEFEYKRR